MNVAHLDLRASAWSVFGPLWCLAGLLFTGAALAQSSPPTTEAAAIEAQARVLSQANAAVVGVRAFAVEGAASAKTLGPVRQGSGVVIGADGLVLTIGYLILEAQNVELHLAGARMIPARVVAYDVATGFGLLQALAPLRLPPAQLGNASALSSEEPLMISSGGDDGDVSIARMVSRRPFSGYWEYHIDSALFTSPPRTDHSGAALFNGRGELMGIGSLIVMNALGDNHPRVPGNMFVPVDLLKPILAELRERGVVALEPSRLGRHQLRRVQRPGACHARQRRRPRGRGRLAARRPHHAHRRRRGQRPRSVVEGAVAR